MQRACVEAARCNRPVQVPRLTKQAFFPVFDGRLPSFRQDASLVSCFRDYALQNLNEMAHGRAGVTRSVSPMDQI